ncbi:MAG TPA: hypothetical protein PKM27_10955 [Saprospiraceae bacterium]|nr:hypothetical protein [Saprospiraceae bacterium]HNT21579.1 hypothetical protein [Saprospiraceae bacterium]
MNSIKNICLLIAILFSMPLTAQRTFSSLSKEFNTLPKLTLEPGVGIHTNFGTDFLITTLIQWNWLDRLSFASHSSFNINNITQRSFNGIKTRYNYSINQKLGLGTTFYTGGNSHSVLLMAGIKYTSYRETLEDARFEPFGTAIHALSPDYGLMYSHKKIWKKYFFTYRMYVPLYPWPAKGSDLLYLEGNMDNIALEVGLGIRII